MLGTRQAAEEGEPLAKAVVFGKQIESFGAYQENPGGVRQQNLGDFVGRRLEKGRLSRHFETKKIEGGGMFLATPSKRKVKLKLKLHRQHDGTCRVKAPPCRSGLAPGRLGGAKSANFSALGDYLPVTWRYQPR
jgi:hypothetical protein